MSRTSDIISTIISNAMDEVDTYCKKYDMAAQELIAKTSEINLTSQGNDTDCDGNIYIHGTLHVELKRKI